MEKSYRYYANRPRAETPPAALTKHFQRLVLTPEDRPLGSVFPGFRQIGTPGVRNRRVGALSVGRAPVCDILAYQQWRDV
jgi:hypothetical protein